MLQRIFHFITFILLLCMAMVSYGDMYRYKDGHGNWVYSKQVPAEFISRGYEVLGDDLRFIREVPRALTKEELALQASKNATAEQSRLANEEQQRKDDDLLRRFSSIDEIGAAKQRKMTELQGKVSILQGNVNGTRQEIISFQSKAADLERDGKTISSNILEKIEALKQNEVETLNLIAARKVEIKETSAQFDGFVERFKTLKANR